jgi:hypothetical protein
MGRTFDWMDRDRVKRTATIARHGLISVGVEGRHI